MLKGESPRNRCRLRWGVGGLLVLLLMACGRPQLPEHYTQGNVLPRIYPDYAGVTIPVNIAPLCFELLNDADAAVTRFSVGGQELLCEGLKVRPDQDAWRSLLSGTSDLSGGAAPGSERTIGVEVFAQKDGQWMRYQPFSICVSPDSIDPWLSFRYISPSYVSYEELTINQRCLENFDERVIASNMLCSTESGGQCITCHSFQQYSPRRMQLHARHTHGGTVIAYDGELQRVDIVSPQPVRSQSVKSQSPAVYPAWHPTEKLIAYSCNSTLQSFHTVDIDKIEVYDAQSSLILYDVDSHVATTIEDLPDEMATFPAWAPDGQALYYCSARFAYEADSIDLEELTLRAEELKYNIFRRPFDPQTRTFGERELVFSADSLGQSATLPRLSPDGRWLLFTMGRYGTFHIWHRDADLWLLDLASGEARPFDEVNSPNSESYHSWSSNGRWVVFSSRRHDGVFTRPFFAHVSADGRATKPFELPCQDPDRHLQLLKSYNVPELMTGPVSLTPQQIAALLKEGK